MKQSAVDNIESRLTAFLGIFNTGIDILLPVAEIYAVLDGHVLRVCIARGCERARSDIVPGWYQRQKIDSLAKIVRRPTYSIRLRSNPKEDQ
jgi:hypothetical protein